MPLSLPKICQRTSPGHLIHGQKAYTMAGGLAVKKMSTTLLCLSTKAAVYHAAADWMPLIEKCTKSKTKEWGKKREICSSNLGGLYTKSVWLLLHCFAAMHVDAPLADHTLLTSSLIHIFSLLCLHGATVTKQFPLGINKVFWLIDWLIFLYYFLLLIKDLITLSS